MHPEQESSRKQKHPTRMLPVAQLELTEHKGIIGSRYFGTKRQVSAIETEYVQEYGRRVKTVLVPGMVRSNIELKGIDLLAPVIQRFGLRNYDSNETKRRLHSANICLTIGKDVVLRYYQLREPCWQMDRLAPGLQHLMRGKDVRDIKGQGCLCQGVIFQVERGGTIHLGDAVAIRV